MKCKVCDYENVNPKSFLVREMMFGNKSKFNYFQCEYCHCIQIINVPENINEFYPETYYSLTKPDSSTHPKQILQILRTYLYLNGFQFLFELIRPNSILKWMHHLKANLSSKILDIGCGKGDVLLNLKKLGFNKLVGIDPYIATSLNMDGISIEKQNINNHVGLYDIIMFNHSFEHIDDQQETVKQIKRLLYPGGLVMIRIPIIGFAFENYQENWVQWDAPRHFFLHSFKSINTLFNKNNFQLDSYFYDSTSFQYWGSEQYIKDIPLFSSNSYINGLKGSIFSKKEINLYNQNAKNLNKNGLGDQVCLFFKCNGT